MLAESNALATEGHTRRVSLLGRPGVPDLMPKKKAATKRVRRRTVKTKAATTTDVTGRKRSSRGRGLMNRPGYDAKILVRRLEALQLRDDRMD